MWKHLILLLALIAIFGLEVNVTVKRK